MAQSLRSLIGIVIEHATEMAIAHRQRQVFVDHINYCFGIQWSGLLCLINDPLDRLFRRFGRIGSLSIDDVQTKIVCIASASP